MPQQWTDASGTSVPLSEVKAEMFKALAHPARVRALEVLVEGERSVGELQPLVGIELSNLSQQLGVLRRAGSELTSAHASLANDVALIFPKRFGNVGPSACAGRAN